MFKAFKHKKNLSFFSSIKIKTFLIFLLIIIVQVALSILIMNSTRIKLENLLENEINKEALSSENFFAQSVKEVENIALSYSKDHALAATVERKNNYLQNYTLKNIFQVVNRSKKVNSMELFEPTGKYILGFYQEGNENAKNKLLENLKKSDFEVESAIGINNDKFLIYGAAPIKISDEVMAYLQVSMILDEVLLQDLKKIIQDDIVVFEKSGHVVTTNAALNQRFTKTSTENYFTGFLKGNEFLKFKKEDTIELYKPMLSESKEGSPEVLFGVIKDTSEIKQINMAIFYNSVILIGIIVLIMISAIFYFNISIIKPIIEITRYLKQIEEFNLKPEVNLEKVMKKRDEIGILANISINMRNSLYDITSNIINESHSSMNKVKGLNNSIETINSQICNVQATTQDFSATTQETLASINVILDACKDLQNKINTVYDNVQMGLKSAEIINEKAHELYHTSKISKENANIVLETVPKKLTYAIEEARNVQVIYELAEAVYEISNQVKMLSLNASIEAAKTGVNGKGFAVIANQMKLLTEKSKSMTDEIRKVTHVVNNSVDNLTNTSEELLKFIDDQVVKSYDLLEQAGVEYSSDITKIKEFIEAFTEMSKEIAESIHNIVSTVTQITQANDTIVEGTNNINLKLSTITDKSEEISKYAKLTLDSANKLFEKVKMFNV